MLIYNKVKQRKKKDKEVIIQRCNMCGILLSKYTKYTNKPVCDCCKDMMEE